MIKYDSKYKLFELMIAIFKIEFKSNLDFLF